MELHDAGSVTEMHSCRERAQHSEVRAAGTRAQVGPGRELSEKGQERRTCGSSCLYSERNKVGAVEHTLVLFALALLSQNRYHLWPIRSGRGIRSGERMHTGDVPGESTAIGVWKNCNSVRPLAVRPRET